MAGSGLRPGRVPATFLAADVAGAAIAPPWLGTSSVSASSWRNAPPRARSAASSPVMSAKRSRTWAPGISAS
ncbi:MAG TPA: hypothetical protein VGS62_02040 [Streptosporangiaceae bacterium]|nr:hypothetical protein [Streptosporangiaceae bacterium]